MRILKIQARKIIMNDRIIFSDEQLDFLGEIFNIGAGNAATALTQILGCLVEMRTPSVQLYSNSQTLSILQNSSTVVTSVRMGIVGDFGGDLLFIAKEEDMHKMIDLANLATLRRKRLNIHMKDSIVMEIGNIVAGVYLTAIHDFCKFSIYHDVPTLANGTIELILSEQVMRIGFEIKQVLLTETEFIAEKKDISSFLLMLLPLNDAKKLADAIEQVRFRYGLKQD